MKRRHEFCALPTDADEMRLLVLADPFLPVPPLHYGGIERLIALLLREAQAHHEVALMAHPASQLAGIKLHPLEGGLTPTGAHFLKNCARIMGVVETFRPHLIHNFARLAYLAPFLTCRLPKIMSYHREPSRAPVAWASRLGRDSLAFTGCSETLTRRGARHGGRWTPIANGLDLSTYTFRPHVPGNAPLVFLSRVERVKGAHLAIAAARAAGRSLILAGNRAEAGPEQRYWDEQIAPWLGRDGISYLGPLDDAEKNELLGGAAALLVPIQWEEPFGLVFVEALACGTPIISMNRGALPELIVSGREGFLCQEVAELVPAILQVSGLNRAQCRARAETYFSRELMYARTEELYRRMVERPTRSISFSSRQATSRR
jgi:glycosyltransferase involved in cell wall biosynthesis